MVARIIGILSSFIVATISALGYTGVVLLMAIESACIPLPSEVIMPFSGYLVYGQVQLVGSGNGWRARLRVGLAGGVLGRNVWRPALDPEIWSLPAHLESRSRSC